MTRKEIAVAQEASHLNILFATGQFYLVAHIEGQPAPVWTDWVLGCGPELWARTDAGNWVKTVSVVAVPKAFPQEAISFREEAPRYRRRGKLPPLAPGMTDEESDYAEDFLLTFVGEDGENEDDGEWYNDYD